MFRLLLWCLGFLLMTGCFDNSSGHVVTTVESWRFEGKTLQYMIFEDTINGYHLGILSINNAEISLIASKETSTLLVSGFQAVQLLQTNGLYIIDTDKVWYFDVPIISPQVIDGQTSTEIPKEILHLLTENRYRNHKVAHVLIDHK